MQRDVLLSLALATAILIGACSSADKPVVIATSPPTPPEASMAGEMPPWLLPRGDGEIGLLATDWGPRVGWNSGRPGAGAAVLLPLDEQTAQELTGYAPFDLGHFYDTALSPDGKLLAVSAGATQEPSSRVFRLIDPVAWRELPVAADLPRGPELIGWHPDGSRVFLKSENYMAGGVTILAVSVHDGSWRKVGEVDVRSWAQPLIAPDGTTIYIPAYRSATDQCCGIDVEGDPYVVAVDTATGAQRGMVSLTGLTVGQRIEESSDGGDDFGVGYSPGLSLSPDGARLYVAHADADNVTVVNLQAMRLESTSKLVKSRSRIAGALAWLREQVVTTAEAKGGLDYRKEASVTPDGRHLLITGSADTHCRPSRSFPCATKPLGLQVIDVSKMKLLKTLPEISHIENAGVYLLGTGLSIDWDVDTGAGRTTSHGLSVVDAGSFDVVLRVEPQRELRSYSLYLQAVGSADGRYAYLLTEGDGWQMNDATQSAFCQADCRRISVVDLEKRAVIAQRSMVQQGVNLISLRR